MRTATLASIYVFTILGCSAAPESLFSGSTGAGGAATNPTGGKSSGTNSTGASGHGGDFGFDGGLSGGSGGSTGSGSSGCSQAATLVYVFSSDNAIYSFDPPTKKFTMIAVPDCQAAGSANSMAIDRNLTAWINYIGGIYKFDLTKQSGCQQAPINLPPAFGQVGMGFSTDAANGTVEKLYVDSIMGGGLAKIDTTTNTFTPIGMVNGDPQVSGSTAELTGSGDAKLYGYFVTNPVRVAEIAKGSAQILSDFALTGVSQPSDWAFTFWGGDFYLYSAPGTNATGNSSVIRYSPVTKTVDTTYVADVGFKIVGAGVSTCAPIKQPH